MANQMKISFDGEVVRRWKEKTSTGKEMLYIAVKVPRGDWSDTLRLKVKDAETVKPYAVGSKVVCEAFVGGREWTSPTTGKIAYFTDLNLFKIASGVSNTPQEVGPSDSDNVDEMPF